MPCRRAQRETSSCGIFVAQQHLGPGQAGKQQSRVFVIVHLPVDEEDGDGSATVIAHGMKPLSSDRHGAPYIRSGTAPPLRDRWAARLEMGRFDHDRTRPLYPPIRRRCG